MGFSKNWIDFNRRLSDYFTQKIGIAADDHFIHTNVPYFINKLRDSIALCQKHHSNEPVRILDIGCGRYTYLELIGDLHPQFEFYGMDISAEELAVNKLIKKTIIHDVCDEDFKNNLKDHKGIFQVIISHCMLEHVKHPDTAHRMINFLLCPGGIAVHSYPTFFDPLLVIGHLFPLKLAEKILYLIEPFRAGSGKFPTYYRKCRCFSSKMERWYRDRGFEFLEHRDYYGTAYFYSIFPIQWVLDVFYWLVLKMKLGFFTSHSIVTLQKKR